jgi:hypothetical protein
MKKYVLWGHGHEDRANGLAVAYATQCRDAAKSPKKISNLTHLSFWGHGIPAEFCEMTADAFVDKLNDWKKKNSGLETVDILTCNGRYTANGEKSFTDLIRDRMRLPKYSKLADIKLRGLPNSATPSGKTCNYSILSFDPTTKSWSYVATPGFFDGTSSQFESHMFGAKYFLDTLLKTPTGRQSYVQAYGQMQRMQNLTLQHPHAIFKKMDQKKLDAFNATLKATKQDAFIMVGNSVGSLAWYLQEIK